MALIVTVKPSFKEVKRYEVTVSKGQIHQTWAIGYLGGERHGM